MTEQRQTVVPNQRSSSPLNRRLSNETSVPSQCTRCKTLIGRVYTRKHQMRETETRTQVHLRVAHHALTGLALLHCPAGGITCPVARDRMASRCCQRGLENAQLHPKGPCCTALCFVCSHGSSLQGSSLGPPKKCGERSELVHVTVGPWVTARQAGLLSLLLCLCCRVPVSDGLELETAEATQVALLHDNVIIPCTIPGSPHLDIATVGIIWSWKTKRGESEVPVFEFYAEHHKAIRPGATVSLVGLERGNGSLYLPRIELREAGEYRCKFVVTPEQAEGTVRLEVLASPAVSCSSKEEHMICKLDRFYPEAFDIKWEKRTLRDAHFQEIAEGIVVDAVVENDDGTFSVTSSLAVKVAPAGDVYHCVVQHRSWLVPQSCNFTLHEQEPGSVEIYFTIVGPCVLLASVVVYALWKCLRPCARRPIWSCRRVLFWFVRKPVALGAGRGYNA